MRRLLVAWFSRQCGILHSLSAQCLVEGWRIEAEKLGVPVLVVEDQQVTFTWLGTLVMEPEQIQPSLVYKPY